MIEAPATGAASPVEFHRRRRFALFAWVLSWPFAALAVLAAGACGALLGAVALTTTMSGDYGGYLLGAALYLSPFVALALLVSLALAAAPWLFAVATLRNLDAMQDPDVRVVDEWDGRVRATGPLTLAACAGLGVVGFFFVLVA